MAEVTDFAYHQLQYLELKSFWPYPNFVRMPLVSQKNAACHKTPISRKKARKTGL